MMNNKLEIIVTPPTKQSLQHLTCVVAWYVNQLIGVKFIFTLSFTPRGLRGSILLRGPVRFWWGSRVLLWRRRPTGRSLLRAMLVGRSTGLTFRVGDTWDSLGYIWRWARLGSVQLYPGAGRQS